MKIAQFSSHFSSLHKITNKFNLHKNIFPFCDFFQIWNNYNAHLGLHFPKLLKNSRELCMYYNITFFMICCHTYWIRYQCYGSENFPNTIMLDCFEGFSNQSNVDELVISSMSGSNHNNYKLNNNLTII